MNTKHLAQSLGHSRFSTKVSSSFLNLSTVYHSLCLYWISLKQESAANASLAGFDLFLYTQFCGNTVISTGLWYCL